ncbi:Aldo/keto reductase [Guyanagaster necrorhizus]|uniref:Aldo/keto reductase n=1 Tax=Guyanagaster necrorhizus TaxID=856835 RepID=A0A9P8AQ66_9AGAR|nr:Aldo/keto reductase [Guyanagaster necrorhizus MCA 3950]KAG7443511.1 Aldo/keto reductase [Guyanagaster necrorhizus MCA 3950]
MSAFYPTPPPPATKLGHYRVLSPLAGVRVSPLQLGGMSIGDKWVKFGMGSMDKESSFKLLDAYYDMGGNFIDTANGYQDESSEEFIGEWMQSKGIRDQIVVATKYTANYKHRKPSIKHQVNYAGNHAKSLNVSVTESLRKLRTNYIDILYVHCYDFETSVQETMNSLHTLVLQGKVLYLGISDSPAWFVAQANTYALQQGKSPFVIYQGRWNLLERSFEREIIPMARTLGLALAPWDVLCGGRLRTDEEEEERRRSGEKGRTLVSDCWERTENEKKVSKALETVARELGVKNIRAVAIAYLMQKTPYVFPLIGGRKIEHLTSNLEALDVVLLPEQTKYLESILPFDLGFPGNFAGSGEDNGLWLTSTAYVVKQPLLQPIKPASKL